MKYEIILEQKEETLDLFKLYYPSVYTYIRKKYEKKGGFFTIAKDEDKIIAAMATTNDFFFLYLVVHPDYRRRGIANKLRYLSMIECRDRGAKVITIMQEDNEFNQKRLIDVGFELKYKSNKFNYYYGDVDSLNYKLIMEQL